MQQLEIQQALNPAYRKIKPNRSDVNRFIEALQHCLEAIEISDRSNESEEHIKSHLRKFFEASFYSDRYINTKERIDLAIYLGNSAKSNIGVLIEAKRLSNKAEFPTPTNLNKKAVQELLLYYLRERVEGKNNNIKQLIATNGVEWFLFKGEDFYAHFYKNKKLLNEYEAFRDGKKDSTNNELFYKEIAAPFIEEVQSELPFVYLNLKENTPTSLSDRKLNNLYKLFSPVHWLGERFGNDSNQLNKAFYNELLHIIGLTETKQGSKKLIERLPPKERNEGSLLENAIEQLDYRDKLSQFKKVRQFGDHREEQLFSLALDLCITWVNRILFLKLLEAQLIQYNKDKEKFSFLNTQKIENFDELDSLFFQVLAKKPEERNARIQSKYAHIPYLNSSLFEPTDHEQKGLFITELDNRREIPVFAKTKLKDVQGKAEKGELHTLAYLFRFLDAYDFASDGEESIQEDNKSLINASVLGLIFEKINGYKDGSFFTPGFITMYMCRETIRKAVVQKFSEAHQQEFTDFEDLKSFCFHHYKKEDKQGFNQLVNSLKICDPAVGSGHFLVSALNEILAIKSELRILIDEEGLPLQVEVNVVNDELVITDEHGNLFEYSLQNAANANQQSQSQRIQKTLFHEKQQIIENCLFGVDINPNSVKICRLRLWIELLKHAYYKKDSSELETLPNIDINIKSGNSLISRFDLDADLGKALKESKWNMGAYRDAVTTYRNARNKEEKRAMMRLIKDIKSNFRSEINANDPKKLRLEKAKGKLFNMTQQTDLFEKTKAQQKEWKTTIDKLSKQVNSLEAEIQEIKDNKIYENAFEWRFEFPEVLDEKGNFMGFDVVIGNPPYFSISSDKTLISVRDQYQTFSKTGDIYALFVEHTNKILRDKAIASLIISNKWLRANYGQSLRMFLSNETNPIELIDFGQNLLFENAIVHTNIITFKKESSNNLTSGVRFDDGFFDDKLFDFEYFIQNNIIDDIRVSSKIWNVVPSLVSDIQIKIEKNNIRLKDFDIEINFGLKTGLNKAFIIDKAKKNELVNKGEQNKDIIKPILRGRDTRRYHCKFADLWIINSHNGYKNENRINVIDDYPVIYNHLLEFEADAKRRYDKGNHWTNLRNCAYLDKFEKPKIIFSEIVSEPQFYYDELGYYPEATVFFIAGEKLKYLTAILNSKPATFFFKTFYMGGELVGKIRYKKVFLEQLPIPVPNESQQQQIELLVDQILTQKEADPNADTSALEAEIDVLVYKLYGLTYEEVLVVDEGFAMSEEEYGNLKI